MSHTRRIVVSLVLVAVVSVLMSGCRETPTPVPESPGKAFRLYETAGVIPDPYCDYYAELTFDPDGDPPVAKLENKLDGMCEMAVLPQQRSYKLRREEDNCGSHVFSGTVVTGAEHEFVTILITDHRTRLCRDVVPAMIVVEETRSNGDVVTRYSFDADRPHTLTGVLTGHAAIGGESTGYGITTSDLGLVELSLEEKFQGRFDEGKRVRLRGHFKTIKGTEIPFRRVFVVAEWEDL